MDGMDRMGRIWEMCSRPGWYGCQLSTSLQTEGSPVRFLVRAHAWVAGQVPSWGRARDNWLMYLSLIDVSLPLFLPALSKK